MLKECQYCKKQFKVYLHKKNVGKYCSWKCSGLGRRKPEINRECLVCGTPISFRHRALYCRKHAQLGERGPNWKGGKTKETKLLRNRLLGLNWAKAVYQRDEWTCVLCGHHGGELHAHHILSFKEYPEFREKVENGITLCKECHKKLHYGVEDDRIRSIIERKEHDQSNAAVLSDMQC